MLKDAADILKFDPARRQETQPQRPPNDEPGEPNDDEMIWYNLDMIVFDLEMLRQVAYKLGDTELVKRIDTAITHYKNK